MTHSRLVVNGRDQAAQLLQVARADQAEARLARPPSRRQAPAAADDAHPLAADGGLDRLAVAEVNRVVGRALDQDYLVGAENAAGAGDVQALLPSAAGMVINSTDPTPGDT